ncbi:hypothetical protein GB928_026665 [Shinella curvata]|uniref:histidine kinase n=1 Tax=Shinella curvata TaxID=1817964 RepID=A0ABT8XM29_9HYPH|nr:histidine kinase dimerization/phospho-acceptor domain-containing protein [Shinella curvata]MCJ8055808.1 hypothetical protein [Shinella curvata]MDO6124770.1 hypothetical protein [Shinella curvata]
MARLAADLQKSNKELQAFSYSISHDLRAPFRHIVGFSQLLTEREKNLGKRSRHYLQMISESALAAGELVDDLLTFSHLGRAAISALRGCSSIVSISWGKRYRVSDPRDVSQLTIRFKSKRPEAPTSPQQQRRSRTAHHGCASVKGQTGCPAFLSARCGSESRNVCSLRLAFHLPQTVEMSGFRRADGEVRAKADGEMRRS